MPQSSSFRVRASHPLRTHFPEGSATLMTRRGAGPTTPGAAAMHRPGLGSCAFARHYLRNHCYFLFLRVLRCFSSPGSPTAKQAVWRDRSRRVSPFGHPRVAGYLPLTAAFRSLSRPSSPPRATGIPHAPFLSFLDVFRLQTFSCLAHPRSRGARKIALLYSLLSFFASISRLASALLAEGRPRKRGQRAGASLFSFPACQ